MLVGPFDKGTVSNMWFVGVVERLLNDAALLTAHSGSWVRFVASIDRDDRSSSGRKFMLRVGNGSLPVARPCVDGVARLRTMPARLAHTTRRHSIKLLAKRRR